MTLRRLLPPAFALILLSLPATASAQFLSNALFQVTGGQLDPDFGGGTGVFLLNNLAAFLTNRASLLIYSGAMYIIVRSGLRLINSQDNDKLDKAKRSMAASLVAIMLAYLTPKLIDAFYGGINVCNPGAVGGSVVEGCVDAGAAVLSGEINGIIRWALVIVAPAAIAVIVVSALRALSSFGKEESTQKMRQAVVGVVGGLALFLIGEAVKATFGLSELQVPGAPTAAPIIVRISEILKVLMGFLALLASGVIIYAGILMVLNLGNEDQITKARGLILRALLGLFIIFISYAFVQFVVTMITTV